MLCQTPPAHHNRSMKLALQITAAAFTALFLASCGSSGLASNPGNHPSGTGPFDSRGNYVEDWADSPSKWKRGGGPSKPGDSLNIVANDDVPTNSIPIPTADNTPQPGNIGTMPVVSRPAPVRTTSSSSSSTASRNSSSDSAPSRTSSSSSASTASKPKPKPKPAVASKPKAKKPTTARYTVKKGDTLSAIASRNGTSVSALQRANGIKGALIQPGKSLVIPK